MRSKIAMTLMAVTIMVVLIGKPNEIRAQVSEMPSQELMGFYLEWGSLYPLALYVQALCEYNEMLYESKKVNSDDCIKFNESIGTIASIMKKAWSGVKDKTISKEMEIVADDYIDASKIYAEYYQTGSEDQKDKAEKKLEDARNHWDNINKYIESKLNGE